MQRLIATLTTSLLLPAAHGEMDSHTIHVETLLETTTAWDGSSYETFPQGKPEIIVLKITIPAHTTMDWHSHPMPSVGYIIAGELTIEKQDGSAKRAFYAGQALPETVDTIHRGVAGDEPVELVVFYAGTVGMPLSQNRIADATLRSAKSTTDPAVMQTHISSTPAGAEIQVDGAFVGVTPSDVDLTCCWHDVTIIKPGRKPWTRRVRNTSRQANIHADLQKMKSGSPR